MEIVKTKRNIFMTPWREQGEGGRFVDEGSILILLGIDRGFYDGFGNRRLRWKFYSPAYKTIVFTSQLSSRERLQEYKNSNFKFLTEEEYGDY